MFINQAVLGAVILYIVGTFIIVNANRRLGRTRQNAIRNAMKIHFRVGVTITTLAFVIVISQS